jgi:cation diffusion facilitator family transporter
MEKLSNLAISRRTTLIGAIINVLLATSKITIGLLGNSAALLADGIHSATDLFSDLLVFIGITFAHAPPDREHPYGHGKFESLTTFMIALLTVSVGIGICFDAWNRLQIPHETQIHPIVLSIILLSIASKEWLYQYTNRIAKKIHSQALAANAWHHRSDAISSVAALVGIGGALAGFPILDPLAAIAVALIIARAGWHIGQGAFQELTDTSVPESLLTTFNQKLETLPGVLDIHRLRARRQGPDMLIDLHVVVPGNYSVSEGHAVTLRIEHCLEKLDDSIREIVIHVDHENDQEKPNSPLFTTTRESLTKQFNLFINEQKLNIILHQLTPHYSHQGIYLEIVLKTTDKTPPPDLNQVANLIKEKAIALTSIHGTQVSLLLSSCDPNNK